MLLTKFCQKSPSFRKQPFIFRLACSVFRFHRYLKKWCKQVGQDQYRAVGAIHIHRNGLCTSLLCIFFLTSRTLKRRWLFPTCLATCYQNCCGSVVSYQGRGTGSRGCQVPPVTGILGEAGTLRSSRQGCGSAASACLPPWLLLPPKKRRCHLHPNIQGNLGVTRDI